MVEIVAEIGVNHNGSLEMAKQLIKSAADTGVDTVKFQFFIPEVLEPAGKRREVLKRLQLTADQLIACKEVAKECRVDFLCTPFCMETLRILNEEVNVDRIKIASGYLNETKFLEAAAKTGKPIIISTGMSTWEGIGHARKVLSGVDNLTVLHCTSAYPCNDDDVNLEAIVSLSRSFDNVGFSDHSRGIVAAVGAVVLGACMIEKHFTYNRNADGPDHHASVELPTLMDLVFECHRAAEMLGSGNKVILDSEERAHKIRMEREKWMGPNIG